MTDKGFGFIARPNSPKNLILHSSSVTGGGFDDLREGQGPKGPSAENVQPS
ncbi:MAG: cold shock domain-containing protein [Planctomycetota bacterium]